MIRPFNPHTAFQQGKDRVKLFFPDEQLNDVRYSGN